MARGYIPSATGGAALPTQTGNAGKVLATDGTAPQWSAAGTINTTDVPRPLGTANPGTGTAGASPSDHVHAAPASTQLSDADPTNLADGTVQVWSATAGKRVERSVPTVTPLWQAIDAGVTTLPRLHQDDSSSFGATPGSGVEHFTYFLANRSATVNMIRFQTGSVAAATSTLARVGLYTVAANGSLTLVASCANKTTFTGTFAAQTCALTVPYALVAGEKYAVGILQVATTPASLLGAWVNALFLGATPALAGTKASQADLAASVAAGALPGTHQFPVYFELIP